MEPSNPSANASCRKPAGQGLASFEHVAPVTVRRGEIRWRVRSPEIVPEIEPILANPDGCLVDKDAQIKDSILVTVGRVTTSLTKGRRWILRRTNYGKPVSRWRDFFRVASPLRAFQNGLAFERAGIATPRVLAAGIVRVLQLPRVGYLLVEEITPAQTLVDCYNQNDRLPRPVVKRVAELVVALHERGFLHLDLTIGSNILLDERLEPWLIDLQRARSTSRPVGRRGAVEEFRRLARQINTYGFRARTAAMWFLKYYCSGRGWHNQERSLAEQVVEKLRRSH
jgi:tRNA A-37 threonylcarbamoyl transferase component Bud32